MSQTPEAPVNPIPPVVIVITMALMAVEGVLSLGESGFVGGPQAIGWRLTAVADYAYSPRVLEVAAQGTLTGDVLRRFVTYPFVHANFTHALFASALFLALGKFVGDIVHWTGVVILFLFSTVFGAVVLGLVAPGNPTLLGAYPAVYGMIGAFTYLMWLQLGAAGKNQLMAFRLIAFLLVLQLVFGLLFGGNQTWIADVAGFFAGLAVAPLVAPGGWGAMLDRMRQR